MDPAVSARPAVHRGGPASFGSLSEWIDAEHEASASDGSLPGWSVARCIR